MDKQKIRNMLISTLEERLEKTKSQFCSSRQDVIEAEGRMKTRYDSARTESAYVADALAKKIADLQVSVQIIKFIDLAKREQVSIGSLVEIYDVRFDSVHSYFMLPVAGGERIGDSILTITPQSPFGALLVGKQVDDDIEFRNAIFSIRKVE